MPTPDSPWRLLQTRVHRLARLSVCSDIHVLLRRRRCYASRAAFKSTPQVARCVPRQIHQIRRYVSMVTQACRTIRRGAMIVCARSQRLRYVLPLRRSTSSERHLPAPKT